MGNQRAEWRELCTLELWLYLTTWSKENIFRSFRTLLYSPHTRPFSYSFLLGITSFTQCQLLPTIITHQALLATARFPVMNWDLWIGRSDNLLKQNIFISKRRNKASEINKHQFTYSIIYSKLNYFSLLKIHGNCWILLFFL